MNIDSIHNSCQSTDAIISNPPTEKRKITSENLNEDLERNLVKTKKQRLEIDSIAKISLDETIICLKKQLKPSLKANGFNKETIADLIPRLAKNIFHLNQEPADLLLRRRKMQNWGLDHKDKLNVTFTVECKLSTISGLIEKIHMQLYFPIEIPDARVGEGNWKKIKKSLSLTFPLGKVSAVQIFPSVLQRTMKNLPLLQIQQLTNGIEMQRFLNSFLDSDHQFADTPSLSAYISRKGRLRIELEQALYSGDFTAIRKGLPLNPLDKSNLIYINDAQIVENFINLSETLHLIHQKGIVHGDVKDGNILVKINENLDAKSYLSDIDHTAYLGRIAIDYNCPFYLYWDQACLNNYKLPSSDVHGLICTLAKEFFPLNIGMMNKEWFTTLANDEYVQGQLLYKIASFNLKNQMHSTNLCGLFEQPINLKRSEVLNYIQTEFGKAFENSNDSLVTQKLIKEIEIDLMVIDKIIILLANQFRMGALLWDKLKNNLNALQIFDTGSTELKLQAYADLTSSIPDFPSAESIGKSLKDIKALLNT